MRLFSGPIAVACRGVVWLLLPLMLVGCRAWPWRPGPVSPSVATCRDLSRQGLAAIEQGQWTQAEQCMSGAVAACPIDVEARRHYAETLMKRGASAEALVQLDEAMRLSRHDATLAVRSGEIYLATGQMDAAAQRAERALQIDSTSSEAWALRGRIMSARGDQRRALSDFQLALGYHPDDRALLYEIAQMYRKLDRPDRALVCLQTLGETYSAGEEPRELLVEQAQMLTAVARHGDAAAMYEQALRRGAPSAELQFTLAQAYLSAGQSHRATHAVQAGLALAPDDPRGRELMSRLTARPVDGPLRR
ncbi:MAG: tetratricopeptide repeat protein [Planctomycetes bacterium]|nr:tetratricopeptide repeat protein [Planctomycetota bacterium]